MRWFRRMLGKRGGSSDGFQIEKTGKYKDRAEADAAVISQLISLGADLEQPREVNHYFYFNDENEARSVVSLLLQQGFAAEKRPAAAGQKKWCVFATHRIVVSTQHMYGLTTNLERLATEQGGEYDGWEAALESAERPAQG